MEKEKVLLTAEDERLMKEFKDDKIISQNIDGDNAGKDVVNEED